MNVLNFLSYGISGFDLFEVFLFLLGVTHITIASVTIFLHRCQAHRSVELNKFVSHFFRLWLWMTTGMVTKQWAAIHRKHHAKCETHGDPHSPKIFGFGEVMWRGTELYKSAAKDKDLIKKYGHGTPDDWIENNLYSKYSWQGVALMLIFDFIMFGLVGIGVWAIQMMWIPFFAAGVINGVGHFFGYRNFKTPDQSRNIIPLGILIGGEELHNNHHSFATSPKLSNKWYEFDIGWFYIKILEFLNLAKPRKTPKSPIYNPKKNIIDEDTVAAILASKYELLQKLHSVTKKITSTYLKQNKFSTIDFSDKKKIVINSNLNLVNVLIDDFEKIWNERSTSVEQVVLALQVWCAKAEKSGIKVMQDYARKLHMLTLRESTINL